MSVAEAEAVAPTLHVVTVNDLPRVWDFIAPVLTKACADSQGEFTPEAILAAMGVHDGVERMRLLVLERGDVQAVMGVCVTARADGTRIMECVLAGGADAREWPDVDEQIDEIAREWGCTKLRIPCARKGWHKVLPHWKLVGYVMERSV